MDKKTVKIALIIIAVALVLVVVLLAYGKATSFEHRLEKVTEYEEILMRIDEYALLKIDSDTVAFICNPGADKSVLAWNKPFSVYAEFALDDHSLVNEYYVMKSFGPYNNDYINEASREHYVYMTHSGRRQGVPEYNFYMGLSSTEPSYDSIGVGTEQLQYVELNGLYYFMFLEDFDIYR